MSIGRRPRGRRGGAEPLSNDGGGGAEDMDRGRQGSRSFAALRHVVLRLSKLDEYAIDDGHVARTDLPWEMLELAVAPIGTRPELKPPAAAGSGAVAGAPVSLLALARLPLAGPALKQLRLGRPLSIMNASFEELQDASEALARSRVFMDPAQVCIRCKSILKDAVCSQGRRADEMVGKSCRNVLYEIPRTPHLYLHRARARSTWPLAPGAHSST